MIDPLDALGRLVLAAGLGALVGLEREWRNKSAGLRTNMLITIGAALFTIMGLELSPTEGDASRITSQVVTGVGFLGAGAIIQGRHEVMGLTTAATIWVNAAIGVAAGAGRYLIASLATAVILLVLAALVPVEARLARRPEKPGRS